jgi:hypothetical protein
MNIVVLSDINYEYQVSNLLKSFQYANFEPDNIFYYTIGYNSNLQHKNLIKIPWPKINYLPKFDFYKPSISLDALNRTDGDFCYFDSDIILSKRFNQFQIKSNLGYPCFSEGVIEYPFTFWKSDTETILFDETKLMKYFGVVDRSMFYVMACFFTFDKHSIDFLEEWKSICENKYLLKNHTSYFPFRDETAANVLLWKNNLNEKYDRIFVNTHKFTTFKLCEKNYNIKKSFIDENMYEQCEDSSRVYFYHGTKDKLENEKILNYINENS